MQAGCGGRIGRIEMHAPFSIALIFRYETDIFRRKASLHSERKMEK